MHSGDDLVKPELEELKPSGWQRFVYLSEAIDDPHRLLDQLDRLTGEENSPASAGFPLSAAQVGDRVCIQALNCGEANNRFMGMGLMPGAIVDIISSTSTGSVILALQDHRLGLGAEIAQRIQVTIATTPDTIPAITDWKLTMQPTSNPPTLQSTVKLRDAAIGSALKVIGYEPTARDYKRKLLAMGLTPGTELSVKRHAPLGDPTEIEVRGFRLSLRKAEADALIVEPVRI